MQNIFLIGMMGAGKTTIGKMLAQRINYNFFDSDHVIEERCGTNISTIFSLEGEIGFRKRETEAIKYLTNKSKIILATGGGAILNEENRKLLKAGGIVIYLQAELEALWQRTSQDKTRPLLENINPKQTLELLYTQRNPIYTSMADYIVDTSKSNINSLINDIYCSLKFKFKFKL